MNFRTIIRSICCTGILKSFYEFVGRGKNAYAEASPHYIKVAVLLRNTFPDCTWIETGTYLGTTTKELSKYGSFIYRIEAEPILYSNLPHISNRLQRLK